MDSAYGFYSCVLHVRVHGEVEECNRQPRRNAYMMQEGGTRVSAKSSILRCCCCYCYC